MANYTNMASAAIHAAQSHIAENAHLVPVFATSTFTFDNAQQGMDRFQGTAPGYIYSRFGNPTVTVAEELIAALEALELKQEDDSPLPLKAILHASGQAAMATLMLSNLVAGDQVLTHYSLYGGTHEFLFNFLPAFGVTAQIADLHDLEGLDALLAANRTVKLIHIESPANPSMRCVDLEAVCRIAGRHQVKVSVDNTFATPYLQQPFRYGVDFVFHSTTKFLNGHGTAIGGVFIGKDIAFMQSKARKTATLLGGCANPFDTYLLIQGIKTLELRMKQHCSNAQQVAEFLQAHPAVAKINFNGLPDHPDYALSARQMRHPGAVMSFELKAGFEAAVRFIDRLQMCLRAVSLGTVDTLISHPASMSHSGMKKEDREKAGISDGLIRLSVGLEHIDDIILDLDQALSA
ncbi:trans-sulfuration enzyme family protein [Chitinophaga eiseniae]|uniref:Aminotransferase class I/II-fold pyridoxal phosphate-dependent enzyme n=1 Tax=Chitinophaga eiseniae TaxID=634771 RepID=A0A847ST14_9BACT|nr:aminotransferase class I/II-fold pyridoxal phosphate-dependent enzyme [Chitinophaga eiseniae]NLR80609.1 aminotransferase class I/II-fold pyridoxal phosphate-dependent enzyme [Chitinophaga eiseniae]